MPCSPFLDQENGDQGHVPIMNTPDTPRDDLPSVVPRLRFSLRWLVFAIAVSAGALGPVAMSIRSVQRQNWRLGEQAGCHSSLNNISLAMSVYSEEHGRDPPAL